MTEDNSSYTVTSPDILLTDDGINILICSHDTSFIDRIKSIYESMIDTSIVFNVQRTSTNEGNIGWLFYTSRGVDVMVIDIDTCDWVDICTALTKEIDSNRQVVFVSEKNKKREAIRLINAHRKYTILRSLEEFEALVSIQLGLE